MKPITVFISYNPKTPLEETLAARLHTIGAASGFTMHLPDRFDSNTEISHETRLRINRSNYFVMFSTKSLSALVKKEIECAFNVIGDKSKILVIYSKSNGKNLRGKITEQFTPFYLDDVDFRHDKLLEKIIETIWRKEAANKRTPRASVGNTESRDALTALIGVGLGLLVLGEIFKEK